MQVPNRLYQISELAAFDVQSQLIIVHVSYLTGFYSGFFTPKYGQRIKSTFYLVFTNSLPTSPAINTQLLHMSSAKLADLPQMEPLIFALRKSSSTDSHSF
jgi:hypothetical protein